jgi:spore coat polysaccharide biosynthesis protein SpsF
MTTGRPATPVVCITQARIGSTRLPGKVLLPVLGEPLLWWHLSRLKRARRVDRVVVATTEEPGAEAILAIAARLGLMVHQGPVDDVLARFAGAAARAGAATVVRVTSDCPLIDPALLDEVIAAYAVAGEGCHYLNLDVPAHPRGLDCEVMSRQALDEAAREAVDPVEREHVTPFIRRRPRRYGGATHSSVPTRVPHRWCVDTPEDFELIRRILEALAPGMPEFGWRDVLALVERHPDWLALNRDVAQVKVV